MRLPAFSLALACALCLTGCSSMVSLNPFVDDRQAVVDPALVGVWADSDGKDLFVVSQSGSHYDITCYDNSSEVVKLQGRLLISGDAKLLDLASDSEDAFHLQVHTPLRVWSGGSTLRLVVLDSDWLKQQATQQLATAPGKDRMLILSPSDTVRAFLLKTGADSKADGEVTVLHKLQ